MNKTRMKKTVVLYYHSIAPRIKNDWSRSFLTHTLDLFEAALKYLQEQNYRVISLDEALNNNWQFRERTACLTFDDGFADFYIYVFPLLSKYKMPGTVFVSTEFVEDYRKGLRPTFFDYWQGKKTLKQIEYWGYMNWSEMREMENTQWVRVESHTASHLKYPCKDIIKDIHHPGSDSLYPIGRIRPDLMTRHIRDKEVEKELPYGYPFFEEGSSVITPIHFPNPQLTQEITALFESFNWRKYNRQEALEKASVVLENYKESESVFSKIESDQEMENRLKYEIVGSKKILEKQLGREVDFLCWPHGDNDERSHRMAIDAGFKATTLGSKVISDDWLDRIPPRFSNALFKGSVKLGIMKMDMKIKQYQGSAAGSIIANIYKALR